MRNALYLTFFLLTAGVLLFLGRDVLQGSLLVTSALTFGGTTAVAVLILLLYRVKLELQASRHELARKEAELNFAYEVQKALFPKELPRGRGLEFCGVCLPARGISGDYFDVLETPDGRQIFAIADISGKGISAAILMANLQALLRREARGNLTPSELSKRLNGHFFEVSPAASFATFFYGQWDQTTGTLSFVNAGHNQPFLIRNDQVRLLEEGGLPLGIFSDSEFDTGTARLDEGDLIVLYSDGITEAMSESGHQFGVERLRSVVLDRSQQRPAEIIEAILEAVRGWSSEEPQDDMTLLVVQVSQYSSGSAS